VKQQHKHVACCAIPSVGMTFYHANTYYFVHSISMPAAPLHPRNLNIDPSPQKWQGSNVVWSHPRCNATLATPCLCSLTLSFLLTDVCCGVCVHLLLVLCACRHIHALGRWWGGSMMQRGGPLLHLLRCMPRQQSARSNRCAGCWVHAGTHSKKWVLRLGALAVDACN
jgi:hypothetical protein